MHIVQKKIAKNLLQETSLVFEFTVDEPFVSGDFEAPPTAVPPDVEDELLCSTQSI